MATGIVNFFFSAGLVADATCSVALAGSLPEGGGSSRGRAFYAPGSRLSKALRGDRKDRRFPAQMAGSGGWARQFGALGTGRESGEGGGGGTPNEKSLFFASPNDSVLPHLGFWSVTQ